MLIPMSQAKKNIQDELFKSYLGERERLQDPDYCRTFLCCLENVGYDIDVAHNNVGITDWRDMPDEDLRQLALTLFDVDTARNYRKIGALQ